MLISEIKQQDIQTAIHRINSRHDDAAIRINEIEATHTARLISFATGELSESDMDAAALELSRLREVLQEDATPALEHFHRLSQKLCEQQQHNQAAVEALSRRREFAGRYNLILSRTHSPTPKEIEELTVFRPHDITGPAWQRFTDARINFAAQPETGQTFGEFLGVETFVP